MATSKSKSLTYHVTGPDAERNLSDQQFDPKPRTNIFQILRLF